MKLKYHKTTILRKINPDQLYTAAEIMQPEILNCERREVYRLIYTGEIRTIKIGNYFRIPGYSLREFIKRLPN
jgi:excisionase family DNA binding protein